MSPSSPLAQPGRVPESAVIGTGTPGSGVSWGAIFAGAAGAAALSLILLILGTGLGLSSISPFTGEGASASTFGWSSVLWLTFVQLAASGIGGFLAGRLRTRWAAVHVDEVYFRDTAHGFLAWAVATLVTAATLTSVIGSIVSGGASAIGAVAGGAGTAAVAAAAPAASAAANDATQGVDSAYFVDRLFRSAAAAPAGAASGASTAGSMTASPVDSRPQAAEAGRIMLASLKNGALAPDDASYLAQQISQRTGLSATDADKRVNDTFNQLKAKVDQAKAQAKEAADKARKASAYAALWLFIALLAGAFVASVCATFGGRRRDLV